LAVQVGQNAAYEYVICELLPIEIVEEKEEFLIVAF
jgi:hypothetical protein